jgi:hypothetical protein
MAASPKAIEQFDAYYWIHTCPCGLEISFSKSQYDEIQEDWCCPQCKLSIREGRIREGDIIVFSHDGLVAGEQRTVALVQRTVFGDIAFFEDGGFEHCGYLRRVGRAR